MNVMVYRICLEEPLLVTALEGDPNSAETLHFIPGSVLRGALLSAYMRKHGLEKIDAGDPEIRELFFNGDTRFLNAYPLIKGQRSLPAPLSWRQKKGKKDGPVRDAMLDDLPKDEQWKGISSDKPLFIQIDDQGRKATKAETSLNVAVHTARSRKYGRPRPQDENQEDANGAVFRYVSLAAGQEFEAVVISTSARASGALRPLLSGETWLGGSRSAGYGKVQFTAQADPALPWCEYAQANTAQAEDQTTADEEADGSDEVVQPSVVRPASNELTITFLSDGLFRNQRGQWAVEPEAICTYLEKALKCRARLSQNKAFLRATLTGGFNRKWGLSIPQAQAVQMGSVLVVEVAGCTVEALQKLQETGIGERRAEGFGRVAVNWLQPHEWALEKAVPGTPAKVVLIANSRDEAQAKTMLQRMLRSRMEDALVRVTNRVTIDLSAAVSGIPSTSLNGLLEAFQVARQQGMAAGQADLEKLLERLNESFFNGAKVAGEDMLGWLKKRADGQEDIWKSLNVGDLPQVGGVIAAHDESLAYDYNLRLAIAVLARAVKMIPRQ